MKIIGIDLSGPANHQDTVMTVFLLKNNKIVLEDMIVHADNNRIISTIMSAAANDEVVIGIDAPLSYQDGGGDRPQDKSIRHYIKSIGMSGSSIMPPTLTKMVYLTLRGISLIRRLIALDMIGKIQFTEVHPGAAIGTRIGEENLIHALHYKKELESRQYIAEWFQTIGVHGLPDEISNTSHQIDSCAAALAAWHWVDPAKKSPWQWSATSPEHPFEFCC